MHFHKKDDETADSAGANKMYTHQHDFTDNFIKSFLVQLIFFKEMQFSNWSFTWKRDIHIKIQFYSLTNFKA